MRIEPQVLRLISPALADRHRVIPLRLRDGVLTVACPDPMNVLMLDEIQRATGHKVEGLRAEPHDLDRALERHYGSSLSDDLVSSVETGDNEGSVRSDGVSDVLEAPAVSMVNSFLESAIVERASDIHVEAQNKRTVVRLRIDGVMYDHLTLPLEVHLPVISRVKILAQLDIGEKRIPQDGRFDARFRGQEFDVRVSIVPGITGEKAVMRMLPKGTAGLHINELGLDERHLEQIRNLLTLPYGMVLATGPTGSGKTTTLYACLQEIDAVAKNVLTIEDPVEYQIPRLTQIQTHPKIGLTFALGLRHILRQDPDILMVGEIRDDETLNMCIHASLTGHLVLSTVHCNDSSAAASRMIDMGAEPFLVASSVAAVLSQRLVRRLCGNCKVEYRPDPALLVKLGIADSGAVFYRGEGCDDCRNTGYFGRVSVYELMRMNEQIETAIVRRASAQELRRLCRDQGMSTMLDDGLAKAQEGLTSLEEVMRAIYIES
jgi:type II secretory ATPase GspE/PulE/Tfp pilus assembly ATPase PilB-like protein